MKRAITLFKVTAQLCGSVLIVFALIMLYSWHTGWLYLLELPPSASPFPYYAAINLLLCGLALLAIFIKNHSNLPKYLGLVVMVLSLLSLVEVLMERVFLPAPSIDHKGVILTANSAIGYIWASMALLFWRPRETGTYRDHMPPLFAFILLIGGFFIIIAYLVAVPVLAVSVSASEFNFYGVLGMMVYGVGILASCYHYSTSRLFDRDYSIPLGIVLGFTALALIASIGFTLQRKALIDELVLSKMEKVHAAAQKNDLEWFKKFIEQSLNNEYSFELAHKDRVVFSFNEQDRNLFLPLVHRGNIAINGERYRYSICPTAFFERLFVSNWIITSIFVVGFILAISFGALWRLREQAVFQAEINQELSEDLEVAMDAQQLILEAAEIGTWTYDVDTDVIEGDSFLSKQLGLKEEYYHSSFDQYLEHVMPDYRRYVENHWEMSLQHDRPYEVVFATIWPDKSVHYLLSKGQVVFDEESQSKQLKGINWDITNIKTTQNYLELSETAAKLFAEGRSLEETFQKLLEAFHNLFRWEVLIFSTLDSRREQLEVKQVQTTIESKRKELSRAVQSGVLVTNQSLVGRAALALRLIWSRDVSEEIELSKYQLDWVKGGMALPVFEGLKLIGILELYQRESFTEKVTEELLNLMVSIGIGFGQYYQKQLWLEKQAELAAIVTHSHEGMYSISKEGIVKSWNNGAKEIFGWTYEEIVGRTSQGLYTTDTPLGNNLFMKRAEEGQEVEQVETKAVRKDGECVWVSRITTAVRDAEGKLQGACILVEDITERKQLEESKHEFISMVNHELRTPLTAIHGSIGLLNAKSDRDTKEKELLEVAYRSSERLTQLVNDILTIEKFELGKMEFNYETLPLYPIVEESVVSIRPFADEKKVHLKVEGLTDLSCLVKVEKQRLIQVLLNLISNAIKFSNENGTVTVIITNLGDYVRVAVKDEGIGMKEEAQKKLFQKFFQETTGLTRGVQGTGLGLFITKAFVEKMGGSINFESTYGVGSTFYFDLPLVKRV